MLNKIYNGKNLVFIVASPRSGTTWLQRMLMAASPKIKTGPESFLFLDYIGSQIAAWDIGSKNNRITLQHYMTREDFIEKLRAYTISLMEPMLHGVTDNEIFIEKTNSHALVMPVIHELFPESRYIYMLRDPRDVVASWLAAAKTWADGDPEYSAVKFAQHWKHTVDSVESYKKKYGTAYIHELRYEELLTNTSAELDRVLRFINIRLPVNKIQTIVSDHSIDNMKTKKTYKKIILRGEIGGARGTPWEEPVDYFRKGKIGSWKRELSLLNKWQVQRITGSLMKQFGYI